MNNQDKPNFMCSSWVALPLLVILPLTGCLNSETSQQPEIVPAFIQSALQKDKKVNVYFIAFGVSDHHVDYLKESSLYHYIKI